MTRWTPEAVFSRHRRTVHAGFHALRLRLCGRKTAARILSPGACFAYKGIRRLGAIDRYRCGVFFRLECWMRVLGVSFEVTPRVTGCMMHTDGECFRDHRFDLAS